MKLSPEERKEKRIEVNRQYQLKNKEVLKEKRNEYLKKRLQNMTEEQREKRKEKKKEYLKRRYQNMTEEQKEERREYYKRRYQNRTEEQKNKTITPTPKTNTYQK